MLVAVASFLDARSRGGRWLLRIDDLDTPRVSKEAERDILTSLERHGLHWDGKPIHQQEHIHHYQRALKNLADQGHTFPCTCSRKDIDRYAGCVQGCGASKAKKQEPYSIRMRVSLVDTDVRDEIQGQLHEGVCSGAKNVAVWRRDGIPSYPLSVVVDDSIMGVSHIIRGSDLADNTVLQVFLLEKLGFKRPWYAHIPVVNDRNGEKLSKRDEATTIDNRHPIQNVMWSMQLLGMDPPQGLALEELLDWGIEHWSLENIPSEPSLSSVVSI